MNHDYLERMNQVVQYIKDHSDRKLTLDELAEYANFSKYHFSRIFTSMVGKTPIAYVNEIRLLKAIQYLTSTTTSVTDIAQLCGFDSITTFNSAFKRYYNKTPSEIRADYKHRNFSQDSSNIPAEITAPLSYYRSNESSFLRRIWNMNISVKELPEYEVAYARHVGSYLDTHYAWAQIGSWASEHSLSPADQYFIGISLDDPGAVDEFACRYDACVTLPAHFKKQERVGISFKRLPGGLNALFQFYDTPDKLGITYQSIFAQWLPNSEYEPDERPCLEFCMNDPATDPEGKCKVDLYVPIKKRAD